MFENQTYEAIMARLLAEVPDSMDKREGSFIWDALSPVALELAQTYVELDNILGLAFPQTSSGEYLDMKAAEHGIKRREDESDESLLARILEEAELETGAGSKADYIVWTKEIDGVGNVLVDPLWQGEGTIRIVILGADGREAPQAVIDAVQNHLDPGRKGIGEGKAPPGAKVTVATAAIRIVNATIPGLVVVPGYTLEKVKTNAATALRKYLKTVSPGGVIRLKEAEATIVNALGVQDMGDLLLNGARSNIVLGINELADLGSVSYDS